VLEIDGSMGEGGGQILRTALSLSLYLQRPFRLYRIRQHRSRPGLQRQHLAAVQAAATLGRAEVAGAELNSAEIRFIPHGLFAGDYRFDIGSAGSTTLLLQALLLPLMLAPGPSRLQLVGGTHNPMAPTAEFLQQALVPLLRRMGAKVSVVLGRHGFYPKGGGELLVTIQPVSQLRPLRLLQRGALQGMRAESLLSHLPGHIAERELKMVAAGLGLAPRMLHRREAVEAYCPGNALQVTVESEAVCEHFSAIGERGVPAEAVAASLVQQVRRYLDAGVPVGPYLADQLLVPLAVAGAGAFITVKPDRHTPTNIAVIRRFLPLRIATTELGPDRWRIEVGGDKGRDDDPHP
jgi:RNA 3'-terminal phosphate cyclase (ATP)